MNTHMDVLLSPLDQYADGWLSAWGTRLFQAGYKSGTAWLTTREFDLFDYRNDDMNDIVEMIRCPALLEETGSIFTLIYAYSIYNFNQGFDHALEEALCQNAGVKTPAEALDIAAKDQPDVDLTFASHHDGSNEAPAQDTATVHTSTPDFDL